MKDRFVYLCDGYTIQYVAPNPDNEQGYPMTKSVDAAARMTYEEAEKLVKEFSDWHPSTPGIGKFK